MLFFACSKNNCYPVLPTHLQLMCHLSTCTDGWRQTTSTLSPHSSQQTNTSGKLQLRSKQLTIPKQFSDYWWLFRMQHVSWCGARLAEEQTRKKEEYEQFCISVTTADWGRLYKLFCVRVRTHLREITWFNDEDGANNS